MTIAKMMMAAVFALAAGAVVENAKMTSTCGSVNAGAACVRGIETAAVTRAE